MSLILTPSLRLTNLNKGHWHPRASYLRGTHLLAPSYRYIGEPRDVEGERREEALCVLCRSFGLSGSLILLVRSWWRIRIKEPTNRWPKEREGNSQPIVSCHPMSWLAVTFTTQEINSLILTLSWLPCVVPALALDSNSWELGQRNDTREPPKRESY